MALNGETMLAIQSTSTCLVTGRRRFITLKEHPFLIIFRQGQHPSRHIRAIHHNHQPTQVPDFTSAAINHQGWVCGIDIESMFQSLASSQHRKSRSCRWRLAAFRLLWTFQFPQLPQAMLPLLVRRTKWIRYDCDSSRKSPSRRPWCDHANTQHAIAGMVRRSPSALQQVSLACGTLSRALWTATLVADSPRAEICG